ncbi:hypothetical protein OSB04_012606 [Centaurea solstitialis]|uniref:Uncharacterized protein n=1 Tax=Centaurea solstitialis TaxID=347529 RepID=A0AA38WE52_9ASTR|nr:hypothetical protein OSB04_012606 [Centaurea solstitialis]
MTKPDLWLSPHAYSLACPLPGPEPTQRSAQSLGIAKVLLRFGNHFWGYLHIWRKPLLFPTFSILEIVLRKLMEQHFSSKSSYSLFFSSLEKCWRCSYRAEHALHPVIINPSQVIMHRAERKLQLSYDVMGEDATDKEGKDMVGVVEGDLRSVVLGLRMFDPTTESKESSDQLDMSKVNAVVEKVIAFRHGGQSETEGGKVEINSKNVLSGHDLARSSPSSTESDPILDEASYLSWVEKLKETSDTCHNSGLEERNKRSLPEEKHLKTEAARKKAEEKKLARWEAQGYVSLSVKDVVRPEDDNILSDSGSVNFVYGDCTQPSKVSPSESSINIQCMFSCSCVDDSGNWGHGDGDNEEDKIVDARLWVALAVVQTYNPRRKVPRSSVRICGTPRLISKRALQERRGVPTYIVKIWSKSSRCGTLTRSLQQRLDREPRRVTRGPGEGHERTRRGGTLTSSVSIPELEECLSKASFSAARNSASIHMPQIGYRDASDRSEWYTVERLIRKYAALYGIKIYV